jgi:hypothetical protein
MTATSQIAEYALLVKGEFATAGGAESSVLALPAARFSFTLARSAASRSPSMVHIGKISA